MKPTYRPKLFALILTFLLAFGLTPPAAAEGLVTGDTVPAGTTLNQDAILIGQNVRIDGDINGNVFILGNQVTVNGKVDGSLILIGQNAGIAGTVTGGVYALALTLDLAPNATLARDLYAAAVSLTSGQSSIVGRDLYAVGLDSGLNGQVGRTLHTAIGPIQLYNGVMSLLGFDDLTIKLHFELPKPAPAPSGSLANPGQHARIRLAGKAAKPFDWGRWSVNLLRNWAVLFLFSLLAAWLARRPLQHTREPIHAHFWKALGIGLILLVMSIALIGVGLLLSVLIFAIGLGLNFIGLWQLSLALWAAAYSLMILALVGLWFFISYGTKIIAIYVLSTWIFGKLFHRRAFWLDLLAVLAGTILYSLLRSVPFIGWVFDVLVTAAGAGSAWLAWQTWRHAPKAVVDEMTVEAARLPAKKPRRPRKTGVR